MILSRVCPGVAATEAGAASNGEDVCMAESPAENDDLEILEAEADTAAASAAGSGLSSARAKKAAPVCSPTDSRLGRSVNSGSVSWRRIS